MLLPPVLYSLLLSRDCASHLQAYSATVPEEKRTLIILLLILKRVYIYCLAISAVDIASRRSFISPEGLGKRIQQLNDELLNGYPIGPETPSRHDDLASFGRAL